MQHRGAKIAVAILLSLIFPAAYLAMQLLVSIVVIVGDMMGSMMAGVTPSMDMSGNALLLVTAASGIMTAAVAVLVIKLRGQSAIRELRMTNPGVATLILALVLGVVLNFVSSFMMELVPMPQELVDNYNENVAGALMDGSSPLLMILSVGIIVPIMEEISLRAMPIRALRRAMPGWACALIGGAIFALVHGDPYQMLYVLPVGIVFCFVFVWTESIYASIALHVGYNGLSAVLSAIMGSGAEEELVEAAAEEPSIAVVAVLTVISAAIAGLLIWLIYRRRYRPQRVWNVLPDASSNGMQ